ncbi:hypothetical protein MNBD_ALPHA06-714, partial [hydrothermal vent metagenome]
MLQMPRFISFKLRKKSPLHPFGAPPPQGGRIKRRECLCLRIYSGDKILI